MNLHKTITNSLLATLLCFFLVACGDGGGGTQTSEAVVTFSLTGPAATIGAVDLDIDLPIDFVLATEADGSLVAGVVTEDDTMPADTLIAVNYIPEAAPAPGQLFTGLISAEGFQPGAIFTVTRTLAADEALPDPADFVEVALVVSDLGTGVALPGYSMTVNVQLRLAIF